MPKKSQTNKYSDCVYSWNEYIDSPNCVDYWVY